MGHSMAAWVDNDLDSIRSTLAGSVDTLVRSGADFFICPDNTAHLALESAGQDLALPGLHIAHVVAGVAAQRGFERVGILGTMWTMESSLYFRALAAQGIAGVVPGPADRATVHRVIFDELVNGIITETSRAELSSVVHRLGRQGCDAVALGCTELPLILTTDVSLLPTLDSPRLLAAEAVEVAIGESSEPLWRGGDYQPPQ
jgi:aspartate racemase